MKALKWRVLALAGLLLLSACQREDEKARTEAVSSSISSPVTVLLDEVLETSIHIMPGWALYYDDERFNDHYPEFNPAVQQRYRRLQRQTLAKVKALEATELSDIDRLRLSILRFDTEVNIESEIFPEELLALNQFSNLYSDMAELGSGAGAQPFRNVTDYDNFLRKIDSFVRQHHNTLAWLKQGIEQQIVLPAVLVERILPQLQIHLVQNIEHSVFLQPLQPFPAAVEPAQHERLHQAYRNAIREKLLPSYRAMHDFLKTTYLPHARRTHGLLALPNGEAAYRYYIKRHTTSDEYTADAIHQIGLDNVTRIHRDMQKVQLQLNIKGDLQTLFTFMRTDPSLFFANKHDAFQAFSEVKSRVDAQLPRFFSVLPHSEYIISEIPAFRAASSAAGQYQPGDAQGLRPGVFLVNLHNLKLQPKYGVTTLSLHEATPGHHFQTMRTIENTNLPKYLRYSTANAYIEGWALYAESLGYEMGLFEDPLQHFGNLNDELLRAMRLVIDTGLHAKGWTREQAMSYMKNNSSLHEVDIQAEVERYMALPGQALAYKIGELKIRQLRSYAEQQLGARFDIKAFHERVLSEGALPLPILDWHIRQWVEKQLTVLN